MKKCDNLKRFGADDTCCYFYNLFFTEFSYVLDLQNMQAR